MAEDLYSSWLGLAAGPRPPDHYALLAVPRFSDDVPAIEAATRRQLRQLDKYAIHPDRAKRAACAALMNEVAKARVCLAHADRKRAYDESLGRDWPVAQAAGAAAGAAAELPVLEVVPPPATEARPMADVRADFEQEVRHHLHQWILNDHEMRLLLAAADIMGLDEKAARRIIRRIDAEADEAAQRAGRRWNYVLVGGAALALVVVLAIIFPPAWLRSLGADLFHPAPPAPSAGTDARQANPPSPPAGPAAVAAMQARIRQALAARRYAEIPAMVGQLRAMGGAVEAEGLVAPHVASLRRDLTTQLACGQWPEAARTARDLSALRPGDPSVAGPIARKTASLVLSAMSATDAAEARQDIAGALALSPTDAGALSAARAIARKFAEPAAPGPATPVAVATTRPAGEHPAPVPPEPATQPAGPRQWLDEAARLAASWPADPAAMSPAQHAEAQKALNDVHKVLVVQPTDPAAVELWARIQKYFMHPVRPRPVELTLDLGGGTSMKLVQIPAGRFALGSPDDEKGHRANEGPRRDVTIIRPFYMGVFEVTQEQFEQVMGKNPSRFKGPQNPVDSVGWDDATEFCKKLSLKTGRNVTLPSEAVWEYACRAGGKARFGFGDNDAEFGEYGWCIANSDRRTHPVGGKKPNAFGLYDMHGNVWEWCSDRYEETYLHVGKAGAAAKVVDGQDPLSPAPRVLRGGSWVCEPGFCRSACREKCAPAVGVFDYGFRVVVDAAGVDHILSGVAAVGVVPVPPIPPIGLPRPPHLRTVRGYVVKVVGTNLVIRNTLRVGVEATESTVATDNTTVVTLDSKPAKLAELKEGTMVTVTPTAAEKDAPAAKIYARSPRPVRPERGPAAGGGIFQE